jgi:hypothetical protein
MDVQKYVAELQALKTVLLAAQAEMIEVRRQHTAPSFDVLF